MQVQIAYIVLCIFVAFLGRNTRIGFFGFLAVSVFFSPLVAFIIIMIAAPRSSKKKKRKKKLIEENQPVSPVKSRLLSTRQRFDALWTRTKEKLPLPQNSITSADASDSSTTE